MRWKLLSLRRAYALTPAIGMEIESVDFARMAGADGGGSGRRGFRAAYDHKARGLSVPFADKDFAFTCRHPFRPIRYPFFHGEVV